MQKPKTHIYERLHRLLIGNCCLNAQCRCRCEHRISSACRLGAVHHWTVHHHSDSPPPLRYGGGPCSSKRLDAPEFSVSVYRELSSDIRNHYNKLLQLVWIRAGLSTPAKSYGTSKPHYWWLLYKKNVFLKWPFLWRLCLQRKEVALDMWVLYWRPPQMMQAKVRPKTKESLLLLFSLR